MKIVWTCAALIVASFGAFLSWAMLRNPYSSPEAALEAFYGGEPRPECMQAEPLRRAGSAVAPLVAAAVADPAMPRRRYAIAFLGESQYRSAMPTLETILADPSQQDYFRSDALLALAQIEPERARLLAAGLFQQAGIIGMSARAVLDGGDLLKALTNHAC